MKRQRLFLLVGVLVSSMKMMAQPLEYQNVWCADKGNGTYVNPVINGDFPDIDVVRVDDTYYMVSTTMYHFPGATILKSKDLVNWEYCANPLEKVLNNDAYNLLKGKHHYSQGMWASSLSYHDGKFYLYFPCSTWSEDSQSILLTAEDPEGEWKLKRLSEGYHDPGWLFDDGENGDGGLYVACGINDIWVNKLHPKSMVKLSSKKVLSVGDKGLEGTHMYHIGDYYYLYATYNHGDYVNYFTSSQTIFRSKSPMGPYEECPYRVFYDSAIHQGALIETQTGEWWTMIFKDAGPIGRVPFLEPVKWVDGWPVIGKNGKDVCANLASYKKPDVGKTYEKKYLPTNDAFVDTELGMQWQWNHNPDNSAWSLTERPGYLRLHTVNVTTDLNYARNSLTQRIIGYSPNGTSSQNYKTNFGTVKVDLSGMQDGDVAGLAVFQNPYSFIGVKMEDGKKYLYSERCTFDSQKLKKEESLKGDEVTDDVIYLLAYVNFGTNLCRFYYSYDNVKWKTWGATMTMRYTLDYFVGQRYYLFNYATKKVGGYVDFDWFTTERNFSEEAYGIQGPSGIEQVKEERKLPDDGLYFDLQGRSVSEPTQGLFIRAKDGKKVLFP
ncbi:MAG: glycoside hydrolase 43 family protein [Bacteroidaceae bacterium]|nr:glycoside hydrolase 43 family protein [Bacteroidaceae bacterium]